MFSVTIDPGTFTNTWSSGKQYLENMGWMVLECMDDASKLLISMILICVNSYNGTSELQLERMNVYFNEV